VSPNLGIGLGLGREMLGETSQESQQGERVTAVIHRLRESGEEKRALALNYKTSRSFQISVTGFPQGAGRTALGLSASAPEPAN
jgi:hypothetical protein